MNGRTIPRDIVLGTGLGAFVVTLFLAPVLGIVAALLVLVLYGGILAGIAWEKGRRHDVTVQIQPVEWAEADQQRFIDNARLPRQREGGRWS